MATISESPIGKLVSSLILDLSPVASPIYRPGACPAEATELSPEGFSPGNPQNKRFALKGRGMRVPDEARTDLPRKSQSAQLGRIIGPASALFGRSIWRPFRARRSWWRIPRIETLG
jgi:hypothetical protein